MLSFVGRMGTMIGVAWPWMRGWKSTDKFVKPTESYQQSEFKFAQTYINDSNFKHVMYPYTCVYLAFRKYMQVNESI